MTSCNNRHLVTRTIEFYPLPESALSLEIIFGAVRTFHNTIVSSLASFSVPQLKRAILNNEALSIEDFGRRPHAENCLDFKSSLVMNTDLSDGVAEILGRIHPSILKSHSSLIAESWVDYLQNTRQRPEQRDRNYIQSFWVSDPKELVVTDSNIIIPSLKGELYFNYDVVETYGLYNAVMCRVTRNAERYFLTILYERPMANNVVAQDSSYPAFLVARGSTLAALQEYISIPENNARVKEIYAENILMIRRFVLNRIQQRKCSLEFQS